MDLSRGRGGQPEAKHARYPGVALLLLALRAAWQQVPGVQGRLLRQVLVREDRPSVLHAVFERGPRAWWLERGQSLLPPAHASARSEEPRPRKWWRFW